MTSASTMISRKQPGGPHVFLDGADTTGSVFFVHSGTGTNGAGYGQNPDAPVATIDYAIGLCTANKGDRIYVMPGHAESITAAAGIDADIAGISIIGLGNGNARPTITFTTAAGADVDLDADNIKIKNLIFQNDIDSQTAVLDINASGCVVEDCEFREGASKQFLIAIDINGGAANACDDTVIRNCLIMSTAAGANEGIELGEVADNVLIEGCTIFGDFSDAAIHNPTGKVLTRLRIKNCELTNLQSGDHAIELVSACTGVILKNVVNSTLAAVGSKTAIDPGACYCVENFGSDGVGDVSGVLNPAADA